MASDLFLNIVTFGKHERVKKYAREYEIACKKLRRQRRKYETDLSRVKAAVASMAADKKVALAECLKCRMDLSHRMDGTFIDIPHILFTGEGFDDFTGGISDHHLWEALKEDKPGLATITSAASMLIVPVPEPTFLILALGVDAIRMVASSIKAANRQLREIAARLHEVNVCSVRYKAFHLRSLILVKEIHQDQRSLRQNLETLKKLRKSWLVLYRNIYHPSLIRRVVRFILRLFQSEIDLKEKEDRKLTAAKLSLLACLKTVALFINKKYSYDI